jgi:hypothetical protein
MASDELVSSQAWLAGLLESHAEEIRARTLIVARELDARFVMAPSEELETALRGLFDFVFSTAPDQSEIYLATARTTAPVARLGSGMLTVRWQVAGERPVSEREDLVPLRPVPGGPADHLGSDRAQHLRRAFERAGWTFELTVPSAEGELLARVLRD